VATDFQEFSAEALCLQRTKFGRTAPLRPDQYAQPALALITLRQMEAKFEAIHAKLAPKYRGRLHCGAMRL